MKQSKKGKATQKVFISFSLEGEPAEKFLTVREAKHLKINAELARSLLMPALDQELKNIKSATNQKAA